MDLLLLLYYQLWKSNNNNNSFCHFFKQECQTFAGYDDTMRVNDIFWGFELLIGTKQDN